MKLVLVAALAADRAIGRGNQLLFSDSEDRRHFRAVTIDKPVVMGRRTWDSLPARLRPLPGRRNVVLSRDASFQAPGAEVAPSLEAALERLAEVPEVCIIGGADVYAQALPRADELILTEIGRRFEGADAFFPDWQGQGFVLAERREARAGDGTPLAFARWVRARAITAEAIAAFAGAARAAGFDEVTERRWPPHAVLGLHSHPFEVDALVTEGEMWLDCGGLTLHLRPGARFTLARDEPHAERYGSAGAVYWAARRHAR